VRILAVCDVYDALVSTRAYRGAWTHEAALELIRSESGTAFDPRCVQALEQVLARPGAQAEEPRAAAGEVTKPSTVPEAVPLLPSIPTVYASDPGRIVRPQ
jgi:HD-GYP domain-containing protein (c-di-GMP phosphodiesterase class II)